MSHSISLARTVKTLAMVFAFSAVFSLGQDTARAAELYLSGATQGCLCTNPADAPQPFSTVGFTYTNTTFNVLSVNGNVPGLTLGEFRLDASANLSGFNNQQFSLLLRFDTPLGIGGNQLPFLALITGTVTEDSGGLIVDFDNIPRSFVFSNPGGAGSFDLILSDIFIEVGGVASITGAFLNAEFKPGQVPEPATMLLLATGLAGVAGAARRRRRRAKG